MPASLSKVIVVGASSGMGAALVRQLARRGSLVAAIARRADLLDAVRAGTPDRIRTYAFDTTQVDEVPALFERIVADLGGLDGLVYAAGAMPPVAESEYAFAKDRTMVGISSVAGERGRRKNPAYAATKAAMTAYLEALRNRCSRYGVNVVTAKPGFVDTDMTKGMPGLFWLISADEAASRILALADRQTSASGFVPRRWAIVLAIVRALPSFVFRRLNF
jgi:NAD(P)-dependent dehydrogenase (short-subunit alcohol dehydrogenase family)